VPLSRTRSRTLLAALALLLLYAACRTTGNRPQSRRAPSEVATVGSGETTLRYLILGDSTVVSEGGTYDQGIALQTARALARNRRVELLNLAVSGARVRDVLHEQLPRIGTFRPDVILLDAGANDVTHLTSAASVEKDLQQILDRLIALNCDVRIVVTGSPDMSTPPRIPRLLRGLAGRRTTVLNRVFRRQVERYHLTFAPIAEETGPLFAQDKTLFSDDAFHPNDRGYATWTAVITPALDHALTSQPSHCQR
jgi:lysophospholipase L1-like esterase